MAADKAVPDTSAQEEVKAPKPEIYVLAKNFGPVIAGKSYWWSKGTEFSMPEDAEVVSLMFKLGAPLQLKA